MMSTPENMAPIFRTPTANQRFRARWDAQVRWATVIAVVVHAVAFAFSPTWTAEAIGGLGPLLDAPQVITLSPLEGPIVVADDIGMAAPPVPVPAENDADRDGEAGAGGEEGAEDEEEAALLEAWARLARQTSRRGQLVPNLALASGGSGMAFPRSEVEPPDEEDADEDPDVEGEEVSPEINLPEPDSLRLERLTGVSPELAVMATSAWVLIRNQTEIDAYMRRSYREGRLDEATEGSVSVTLWIDRRGSVEWAEVTESSGDAQLDEFALALFNEVVDFRAARERGETVSRSVTFLVNFPW
jgi:TonB family protein